MSQTKRSEEFQASSPTVEEKTTHTTRQVYTDLLLRLSLCMISSLKPTNLEVFIHQFNSIKLSKKKEDKDFLEGKRKVRI